MIRAAVIGLGMALAVQPAWGQAIEDPYAIIDPLDREATLGTSDEELALGEDEPLTPATTIGIERELSALGYDPGTVDGVLDRDSRDAIRAFQADEGVQPSGEPTVDLYRRLRQSAPASGVPPAGRIEAWRRELVGKPVYGDQAGEIGAVEDLILGVDNRVTGVMVAVVGVGGVDVAHVPVPWQWVDHQIGLPAVVLPWTRADVEWLVGEGGRVASAGGWKTSWLDGAAADIAAGGNFGTVEGFIFDPGGQVESIVVRHREGGRFYDIPRDRVSVPAGSRRVVIHMPLPEVLALQPRRPPGRIAAPDRERIEADLQVELARWENRIDRLALERGERDAEVRSLRRAWRTAKQDWQALEQAGGPNWDAERTRLAAAMDDLRRRWSEVAEASE